MKKMILFVVLISLALFANAQSKIDSTIKKADTAINAKTKRLDNTKSEITNIQNVISDFEAQRLTKEHEKNSLQERILSLERKQNKTKVDLQKLLIEKTKLQEVNNEYQNVVDSLSTLAINLSKKIDSAKKQINEADSTIKSKKKEIDTKKEETKKLDSTIEQRKASIGLQLDSVETIAIIEMRNSAQIYNAEKGTSVYAKIEEVRINVVQGIILEIIVKTDQGVFRNKGKANQGGMVIADLLHLGNFTDKKLKIESYSSRNLLDDKIRSSAYLLLKDVILYIPISSYTNAVYGEFEIALFPTDDKKFYLIKESTSINTYFNVAAFTDIKGISGEPNGVAQFTADAKFMLNTRTLPKTSMVYANYISFQGGLSKFDSQFKGTELIADIVDRKDLFQRSNYKVGIKLNLLKGYLPPNPVLLYNTFEFNVGYNVMGSQIFKTSFKDVAKTVIDTAFKTVTQNQWYAEPTITFSRRKNFSMCIALPCYINNIKKSAAIQNDESEYWAVPSISLMYFGKRDVGSKIFFRYNHYINIKDKTQAFSQMQLGYSLNLTQVLK